MQGDKEVPGNLEARQTVKSFAMPHGGVCIQDVDNRKFEIQEQQW